MSPRDGPMRRGAAASHRVQCRIPFRSFESLSACYATLPGGLCGVQKTSRRVRIHERIYPPLRSNGAELTTRLGRPRSSSARRPQTATKRRQTATSGPQTRIRPPAIRNPPPGPISTPETWAVCTGSTQRVSEMSSLRLVCEPERRGKARRSNALRWRQCAIRWPRWGLPAPRCGAIRSGRLARLEQRIRVSEQPGIVSGRQMIAPGQLAIARVHPTIAPRRAKNVPRPPATASWRHGIAPRLLWTVKRLRPTS
jgi:hypothetical protein